MRKDVKLVELVNTLDLVVASAEGHLGHEVTGGYASDLLSDVLANGEPGNLWITLQIHQNIVAVGSMKDFAGIILVNGREPEQDTVEKAEAENIAIMVTELSTFELVGRLYGLGITGTK